MPASESVEGMTKSEQMDTRSMKTARKRQNADSSSLKLGKCVKLADRMCWVQEPNVTNNNPIQWWPRIEYLSFKELMLDSCKYDCYDLCVKIYITTCPEASSF